MEAVVSYDDQSWDTNEVIRHLDNDPVLHKLAVALDEALFWWQFVAALQYLPWDDINSNIVPDYVNWWKVAEHVQGWSE
jgi:hypothetical protein